MEPRPREEGKDEKQGLPQAIVDQMEATIRRTGIRDGATVAKEVMGMARWTIVKRGSVEQALQYYDAGVHLMFQPGSKDPPGLNDLAEVECVLGTIYRGANDTVAMRSAYERALHHIRPYVFPDEKHGGSILQPYIPPWTEPDDRFRVDITYCGAVIGFCSGLSAANRFTEVLTLLEPLISVIPTLSYLCPTNRSKKDRVMPHKVAFTVGQSSIPSSYPGSFTKKDRNMGFVLEAKGLVRIAKRFIALKANLPPGCDFRHCPHPKLLKLPISPCSRCHSIWYCSTTCQKADWKRHKFACRKPLSLPAAAPSSQAPMDFSDVD